MKSICTPKNVRTLPVNFCELKDLSFPNGAEALVAHWAEHWPTDLAVPSLSPA